MRVLVTGVKGQLGYDVVKQLNNLSIDCIGVDKDDFDITNQLETENFIKEYHPDAIIHCSAFTAVDLAEEQKELCYNVNVNGTYHIAKACKDINAKMIYISTDYVFPGDGEDLYEVDDKTGPLGEYGLTKLKGEEVVQDLLEKYFIVRISWVFGINGNNFIKTMLRLGKERKEMCIVGDQIGSPTYTVDLAKLIVHMVQTEKYGIYHATNEGICSWAEFATEIFRLAQYDTQVVAISTDDYPTKAKRPKNSRMSKKKLLDNGFTLLPHWKDAVERYFDEINSK